MDRKPDLEQEWRPLPDSPLWRTTKILVAFVLIGGLLHLSGIYQFLFYSKTPAWIPQRELSSVLDTETLTVPLNVFIVSGGEFSGSERSVEDVNVMIEKAARIWGQAGIDIEAKSIRELNLYDEEINVFYSDPMRFIYALPEFDTELVTVVLLRHLRGINGLAFAGERSIAVADYTANYDFRVFAHEIGHILGLEHAQNKNRLMYSGADGTQLSMEEVTSARDAAAAF